MGNAGCGAMDANGLKACVENGQRPDKSTITYQGIFNEVTLTLSSFRLTYFPLFFSFRLLPFARFPLSLPHFGIPSLLLFTARADPRPLPTTTTVFPALHHQFYDGVVSASHTALYHITIFFLHSSIDFTPGQCREKSLSPPLWLAVHTKMATRHITCFLVDLPFSPFFPLSLLVILSSFLSSSYPFLLPPSDIPSVQSFLPSFLASIFLPPFLSVGVVGLRHAI
jgi:hypothetical protein